MAGRIILLGSLVSALASCDQKPSKPSPPVTMHEFISDCAPFHDAANRRELDFDPDQGTVTVTVLKPDAESGDFARADSLDAKTSGRFTVDERALKVVVTVGDGQSTEYFTFPQAGVDSCLLIRGTLANADLTASWYGTPDSGEINDANPP